MVEVGLAKSAFITGATRGLGKEIAGLLTERGYTVIGAGSSRPPSPVEWVHDFIELDLANQEIAHYLKDLHPDVVINNAAVYIDDPRRGQGSLIDLSTFDLHRTFQVNFFGAVQVVQWALRFMLDRGTGRIVNVSSGMGRIMDFNQFSFAYRSSKLALNGLTVATSKLFEGADDLAAFSYCPGWIRTDMGTSKAPDSPVASAARLVDLLELSKSHTNGKFFRGKELLNWCERG